MTLSVKDDLIKFPDREAWILRDGVLLVHSSTIPPPRPGSYALLPLAKGRGGSADIFKYSNERLFTNNKVRCQQEEHRLTHGRLRTALSFVVKLPIDSPCRISTIRRGIGRVLGFPLRFIRSHCTSATPAANAPQKSSGNALLSPSMEARIIL